MSAAPKGNRYNRLAPADRRSHVLRVPVSEEELKEIREQAAGEKSLAAFARQRLLTREK